VQFDIKKIIIISLAGVGLGFVFNYFNPSGIPLMREKLTLNWANDSLLIIDNPNKTTDNTNDKIPQTEQVPIDSPHNSITKNELNETESKQGENTQTEITTSTETKQPEETTPEPKAITLAQAYQLFNSGVLFIDAREDYDFNEGHITSSINIPYYQFEDHKNKLNDIKMDDPIVTYCSGTDCDLSILLGNQLASMGYKNVYIFFGGWPEWISANYPTEIKQTNIQ
jgi:rhodanese-related sulfurtransferase